MDAVKNFFKRIHTFLHNKKVQLILVIFFNIGFIISLMVKSIYFQITSKLYTAPAFFDDKNKNMIIALLASIIIIFAICWIISGRRITTVLLVVNILVSVVLFADTLYSRYYGVPIGVYIAVFQMKFLDSIGGSITALLKIKDIVFFIDFPIWIILLIITRKTRLPKGDWRLVIGRICAAMCVISLSMSVITAKYEETNSQLFYYRRDNIAKELGVYYYHYYDVNEVIEQEKQKKEPLTDDEIALVTELINKQEANDYTGIAKDKNIIVLQLEAFQGFVIGLEMNGVEVTPVLNSLINESVYFDNLYNQVGPGNTADAEFIVNNSLHASKNGANYYLYTYNKYFSLANVLKDDEGYRTFAAHPYEPTFWNRNVIYPELGFELFYSAKDFVVDEPRGWSIGDKSFFRQSVDMAMTESDGKPFYLFDISLTSHHPYYYCNDIQFDVGEFEGTMTGRFIKSAHYVDAAIGELIEHLKEKGIYEDTLLVIYGDHSALYEDEAANVGKLLGFSYTEFEWEKIQKIPLIIHLPKSGLVGTYDNISGQIDILPTVANLMDIDIPFMLGRDLLGTNENFAVKSSGTIITKDFMYLNSMDKYYDMKTGEVIQVDTAMAEKYYRQINASRLILLKDMQANISKYLDR